MTGDDLREMAAVERQIAEEIAKRHPHYFAGDDSGAWHACRASELRAEAYEHLAKRYDAG